MFYNNKRMFYRMRDIKREDICIQIERGNKRYYTGFESAEMLEQWYRQLGDEERTCHEVVAGERRKLVIDIDGEEDGTYAFYDFARHIFSRIWQVFVDLEIGAPDVLFYSMCSESRISYHAVVANMAFSSDTCRALCAMISHGQVWENLVDFAVYKRVQHMRIEGSTKYGQRRWKNIYEHGNNAYGVIATGTEPTGTGFFASLRSANFSETLKCTREGLPARMMTSEEFAPSAKDKPTGTVSFSCKLPCSGSWVSKNFQKSLLSNILGVIHPSLELRQKISFIPSFRLSPFGEFFGDPEEHSFPGFSEIMKNFKIRRVSGNVVFLDRIRPSMCTECGRVHMSENAMIRINGNKSPSLGVLVCWRNR